MELVILDLRIARLALPHRLEIRHRSLTACCEGELKN